MYEIQFWCDQTSTWDTVRTIEGSRSLAFKSLRHVANAVPGIYRLRYQSLRKSAISYHISLPSRFAALDGE